MDVFYCLIHTPEAITPELRVLAAGCEGQAVATLADVARDWPRLERIDLYRGNFEIRSFAPSDFAAARLAPWPPEPRARKRGVRDVGMALDRSGKRSGAA